MIRFHFLNVGHGDCCIIEFLDNNRVAMVDINMSSDMDETTATEILESLGYSKHAMYKSAFLLESAGYTIKLQNPINYLKDHNIGSIFRFISTHPHMDHISGLDELYENRSIENIWIIKNEYTQNEDKLSESEKKDWKRYKKYRDTDERTLDGTTIIRPKEGEEREFYTNDGIRILSPNDDFAVDSNANNMSYVLLIEYKGRKVVLGGDAERKVWDHLESNYPEELSNIDVLKASHHGRDSGYHQAAVKRMSPELTVVSVGKKPHTDSSNKYRQHSEHVWSTRWRGNIVVKIDNNGKLSYESEHER